MIHGCSRPWTFCLKKRLKDGTWPVQAKHPGETHFEIEKSGGPSRWKATIWNPWMISASPT
jgi:hypothetical protein